MYQRIITKAADVNGGICSFTRKLQFLIINKVRIRPVINPNTLKLITWIDKCTIKVVIKMFAIIMMTVAHTKVVAVLCSGTVNAHTACEPYSNPTEPCSGPPLPSGPGPAKRTVPGHGMERSHLSNEPGFWIWLVFVFCHPWTQHYNH